jgi:hypothetical protein
MNFFGTWTAYVPSNARKIKQQAATRADGATITLNIRSVSNISIFFKLKQQHIGRTTAKITKYQRPNWRRLHQQRA